MRKTKEIVMYLNVQQLDYIWNAETNSMSREEMQRLEYYLQDRSKGHPYTIDFLNEDDTEPCLGHNSVTKLYDNVYECLMTVWLD